MACEERDWLAHARGESLQEHTKTASCCHPWWLRALPTTRHRLGWMSTARKASPLRNRQTRAQIGFADTQTQQSAPKNMRFRLESRFFSISIRYASENAVFGW